jgi:hypothetical protein
MPIYVPGKVVLAKEFTWNETVWNPSMITTALWLDAADASTITQSSNLVSQWNDKSGNGRNATASSTARPTYSATAFNSKPGLTFDGNSDDMSFFRVSNFRTYIGLLSWTDKTGDFRTILGDSSATDFHGALASSDELFNLNASASVRNGDKWINGTAQSAGNLLTRYTTPTVHVIQATAGVQANQFQDRNFNRFFYGTYAELILVSDVLSTLNRQKIEGYLAHKWGLEANLPSDHPYKTVGPTP